MKELRRIFLVGIFAAAPLGLTVYILVKIFAWFDELFQPLIRSFVSPYIQQPIPGLGVVVGIVFILSVGLVAPSLFGKQIFSWTEHVVEKLPLAKLIYSGTKQIFDSFSRSSMTKFDRVVMVSFPQAQTYAIGFVTREVESGWVPGQPDKKLAVFIPTTPNPTSGYVIFVSENQTIPLKVSVEDALKLVISAGLVQPPGFSH